jgi:hypothetical protein
MADGERDFGWLGWVTSQGVIERKTWWDGRVRAPRPRFVASAVRCPCRLLHRLLFPRFSFFSLSPLWSVSSAVCLCFSPSPLPLAKLHLPATGFIAWLHLIVR